MGESGGQSEREGGRSWELGDEIRIKRKIKIKNWSKKRRAG
jgi:hypothetical protein